MQRKGIHHSKGKIKNPTKHWPIWSDLRLITQFSNVNKHLNSLTPCLRLECHFILLQLRGEMFIEPKFLFQILIKMFKKKTHTHTQLKMYSIKLTLYFYFVLLEQNTSLDSRVFKYCLGQRETRKSKRLTTADI